MKHPARLLPMLYLVLILNFLFLFACVANAQTVGSQNQIVSNGTYDSFGKKVTESQNGDIFILFIRENNPASNYDLYLQKIDRNGNLLWSTNGRPIIEDSTRQNTLRGIPDGQGGIFVTWQDHRHSNTAIYAQHLDSAGNRLFPIQGIPLSDTTGLHAAANPEISTDFAGGAIVTWSQRSTTTFPNWEVMSLRVLSSGSLDWPAPVLVFRDSLAPTEPHMITDHHEGAYIVCRTSVGSNSRHRIARIDTSGTLLWPADGFTVADTFSYHAGNWNLSVTSDSTSCFIVWSMSGPTLLKAQKVSLSGARLWGNNGKVISNEQNDFPFAISDKKGGIFVSWCRRIPFPFTDVYTDRLDNFGNSQWNFNGIPVSAVSGHQVHPRMCLDNNGGVIIVWDDRRNGFDIYAQRKDSLGNDQWLANGMPITTHPAAQTHPEIVCMNPCGAMIIWYDVRNGIGDTYGSLVNCEGTLGTLPVSMSNLIGIAKPNGVTLEWTVFDGNESGDLYVEVSRDGISFSEKHKFLQREQWDANYTFLDDSPNLGPNFYRIKFIDQSGLETYSNIVLVDFSNDLFSTVFKVVPNPTTGEVHIQCDEIVQIRLYDSLGRLANFERIGTNRIRFDFLPSGTYVLEIIQQNGLMIHKKILKRH